MSQMFTLILSKSLDAADVESVLTQHLPGLHIIVLRSGAHFPDEIGDVLVQLNPTLDPNWPLALDFLISPDASPRVPRPTFRLAEAISQETASDVLTDLNGLFPELDPHDPYWWLAYVSGLWHLADAANTPLMGSYTDGIRSFPGDGILKLVRPVNPWTMQAE